MPKAYISPLGKRFIEWLKSQPARRTSIKKSWEEFCEIVRKEDLDKAKTKA